MISDRRRCHLRLWGFLNLIAFAACTSGSPAPRDIVFASASGPIADSATVVEIFAMKPDGSQLRQLTHSPPGRVENNFPEASPDGEHIVFLVKMRDPSMRMELRIIDRDGANERLLARFDSLNIFYPTWAPDGRHIVFSAGPLPDSAGNVPAFLYTIAPDGSDLRQLTHTSVGYGCAGWLPGREGLLVTDTRFDGLSQILRVDFPSGQMHPIVESDSLTFECVFPSPDGTRALLTASRGLDVTKGRVDSMQPYQMTIDGHDLRPLVVMPGYGKDPRWSQDGRSIVFLGSSWPGFIEADGSAQFDSIEIFTTDSQGENLRRLTNNRHADIHPSW